MLLILELSDGTTLDVELVNNLWISNWAKKVSTLSMLPTEHCSLGGSYPTHVEQLNHALNTLYTELQNIPRIINCDIPLEFPIRDSFDINDIAQAQEKLNIIHRWCVFSMMHVPYIINGVDIAYKCSNAIRASDSTPVFHSILNLLHTLNQMVHTVEGCFARPGAHSFPSNVFNEVFWDQSFENDFGYMTRKETDIEDLFDINHYDVYIAKRILGKDFRECWFDSDDVASVDVTNIGDLLHYAFEVDPLNDWHSFYTSTEFKKWMNDNNRSTKMCDIGRIPIGNIINKPINIKDILLNTHIVNIRYTE